MKDCTSHRMVLRTFVFGALLLLLIPSAIAQGWRVKSFSADITLHPDGTFDVIERIKVNFSESKRGIIRKLPYRFAQLSVPDGELAFARQGLSYPDREH